jgi:hypothetical protein
MAAVADLSNTPLRIDPRPLRPDPGLSDRTAMPFDSASPSLLVERRSAIERSGHRVARYDDPEECSGIGGNAPPGGWTVPVQGPHLCVAFARPRAGGAYYPPGGIDERSEATNTTQRTVRALVHGGGQFHALDIVLERGPSGGWVWVERRILVRVLS